MRSLRVTVFDHQQQRLACDTVLDRYPARIGRGPGNDVDLPFPFVSTRQAELRDAGGELRLHDLGARNRIAVGAHRLPPEGAPITARLIASLGPLELRFEPLGPARVPLADHAATAGAIDPTDVAAPLPAAPDAPPSLAAIAAWLPALPGDERDGLRLAARAADLLHLFAACTLELTRLRDEQREALGLAPIPALADTPDELLRRLLAPGGPERDEHLLSLFAALCDHQRALPRAACLAAREALDSLAPVELERTLALPWPTRTAALWRHYEACHAALLGGPRDELSPVFLDILTRHYAAALPPDAPRSHVL